MHAELGGLGAHHLGAEGTRFRVLAPRARTVEVRLLGPPARTVPLAPAAGGYFEAVIAGAPPGARYLYRLDGGLERPDPASRSQPDGVHGPSEVVDDRFEWDDAGWGGAGLEGLVLYELHVGTFTPEGTFDAATRHLAELRDLGVTAVELMPIAQFPGDRNWGYDGVYPYAVQASYGGRAGLKRFVAACHRVGLGVHLDVVYNHLGPEGNYLAAFGPYFTDRYATPWGAAVNVDGPGSDEVRRYFIENALEWVRELHVDGLRLDAVHAIIDPSARPFLRELAEAVHAEAARLGRRALVIAESDLNDPRLVRPRAEGGLGLDAQWSDDFHHALHALITGERGGHYADFGRVEQLAKAYQEGYVYTGERSVHRGRRHGAPPRGLGPERFVVFGQNHDQVGNRPLGDRPDPATAAVRAAAVLLSPFAPLLFMGEEYGDPAPFPYFVSHGDPALVEAVRRGRQAEHGARAGVEVPDPADPATFRRAKLDRGLAAGGRHRALLELHRELLRLRRERPALARHERLEVAPCGPAALLLRRGRGQDEVAVVLNLGAEPASAALPGGDRPWRKLLDTAEPRWLGPGSEAPLEPAAGAAVRVAARSAVVYGAG